MAIAHIYLKLELLIRISLHTLRLVVWDSSFAMSADNAYTYRVANKSAMWVNQGLNRQKSGIIWFNHGLSRIITLFGWKTWKNIGLSDVFQDYD